MEKEIKYYLPVVKAKIPLGKESVEEIEEFVHALLVLRVSVFLVSKYIQPPLSTANLNIANNTI
jgi:hypothetical protein